MIDHLNQLTMQTCLLIGVFASVSAVLLAALWRGRGATSGRRALPAGLRTALFIVVFAGVGLVAFDNRRAGLLMELAEGPGLSLSTYCKPPRAAEPEVAPAPAATVVKARGCGLILRAYRLGYTKDLGSCAPKKAVARKRKHKQEKAAEPCHDRQRDEPLFHYAWRVLADRAGKAAEIDPVDMARSNLHEFQTRLGYVNSLAAVQSHAITSSPHAAHHLWINLPAPHPRSLIDRYLVPQAHCSNRYVAMQTRVRWPSGDKAKSALIEHALGRLLFDRSLGEAAGYCGEFTIHWGASADACDKLAADPAGFLRSSGAYASVHAVFDRYRTATDLRQLARKLGDRPARRRLPDPRTLVSFQCLIVDSAGNGKMKAAEAKIGNYTVDVRQVHTKLDTGGAHQLAAYKALALVLSGVAYNGPVIQDAIGKLTRRPAPVTDAIGDDFLLTRLDVLRQSDPFVAGAPALAEPRLLDVYPFHYHLFNLVTAFRRAYVRQRGRL